MTKLEANNSKEKVNSRKKGLFANDLISSFASMREPLFPTNAFLGIVGELAKTHKQINSCNSVLGSMNLLINAEKKSRIFQSYSDFASQSFKFGETVSRLAQSHSPLFKAVENLAVLQSRFYDVFPKAFEQNTLSYVKGNNKFIGLIAKPLISHMHNSSLQSYRIAESLNKINLPTIEKFADNFNSDNIRVNKDGSILFSDRIYGTHEIQNIIDDILERSGIGQRIFSIEQAVEKLIHVLPTLKETIVQKIVWIIIGCLFTTMSSVIIYNVFESKHKEATRVIKKSVPTITIKIENGQQLRFVTSKYMLVRERPDSKSRIIGTLYFSYTVRVIEKHRNWALVEWVDSDNKIRISGWVSTRYLCRFAH